MKKRVMGKGEKGSGTSIEHKSFPSTVGELRFERPSTTSYTPQVREETICSSRKERRKSEKCDFLIFSEAIFSFFSLRILAALAAFVKWCNKSEQLPFAHLRWSTSTSCAERSSLASVVSLVSLLLLQKGHTPPPRTPLTPPKPSSDPPSPFPLDLLTPLPPAISCITTAALACR